MTWLLEWPAAATVLNAGVGLMKGDVTTINEITTNVNASVGPVGTTLMFDEHGFVGGTINVAAEAGASVTHAQTGAVGTGRNPPPKTTCP